MKNAYIWWYYYRLVCGNFRCNTNGRKNASTSQKLIMLLVVKQMVLTTTQIKFLFRSSKELKREKKKQYTFIKHLAFIAKNYLLS